MNSDIAPPNSAAILPPKCAADLRIALCCWLLSNVVVLAAVWIGVKRLPSADWKPPGHRTYLEAMLTWDGDSYRSIAKSGYRYQPHHNSNIAFFPVYPLASLDLALLTGSSIDVALVVVSNLCFAAALMILSGYCRHRWPAAPERLHWLVVLACALFPAGCFFHMAYSESCFLLLSVIAFYGFARRWPLAVTASVVGLATAARPTGAALLAPLALYIWQGRPSIRSRLLALVVWLPLGCWGLAAYMAYQEVAFGNPLAFADAQATWRIRPPVPLSEKLLALGTLEPLRAVYMPASPAYWGRWGGSWPLNWQFANPLFFMTVWGLVAVGWRRRWLSSAETSFSLLLMLIPYLTRGYEMGMGSMGRFVSVAFPIYIVHGHLLARAPKWAVVVAFGTAAFYLAAFSALFAARNPVF